jgi:2,5-diketo-D-gluconate reductase A
MRIVLSGHGDGASVAVHEQEDVGSFSVVSAEPDAAAAVLQSLGDGGPAEAPGHVTVRVDAVRRLTAGRVAADWSERFAAMLDYADRRGWLIDEGAAIVAHVEQEESARVPSIELNSGRVIPQLGYGVFRVPPDDAERLVSEALEAGYRHIDTAAAYRNEAGVGRAIRSSGIPRDELFVTTKLFNDQQGAAKAPAAFEASLDALGLDEVDLYLIHWPAPKFDLYVETWHALEAFHRDGRARSIGVSNFLPHHLERLLARAEFVPSVNQIELHPILQQRAAVEFCRERGIAIEAWSPLGAGQLPLFTQPAVADAAAALGRTPAQVVLRWHVQQGFIVFPKTSSAERMRENLAVFDFALDDEQMAAVSALERGGRVGFHPDEWH